jgi:hypothetical protein
LHKVLVEISTSWLPQIVAPVPQSGVKKMACYSQTHISPMLKITQNSQELMHEDLAAKCTGLQKIVEALSGEQRLLKFELGEYVAKSPEDHKVSTLKRMQELTSKVHQKADASDVAKLSFLVEKKIGLSSTKAPQDLVDAFEDRLKSHLQEFMARFDKLEASVAKKADSEHVATMAQLQEMRMELLAATPVTAEHKGVNANMVEATGQDASKNCLSKMLKNKLTNAEEDNERLEAQLRATMKQLESLSTAKAVDFEAPFPTVADAEISQIGQSEPEPVSLQSAQQLVDLNSPFFPCSETHWDDLDAEFTFLSDDSDDEICEGSFHSEGSTQDPDSPRKGSKGFCADTEASLQEECAALKEQARMQQAEQEGWFFDVAFSAQKECDRVRDQLEKASEAWNDERRWLTARHNEELVAWQELDADLAQQNANLRAVLAEKHETVQQVQPTKQVEPPAKQVASKRTLSNMLKVKLTNAEEENERLLQERELLSQKLQFFKSITSECSI